jgi:hypothetical protein
MAKCELDASEEVGGCVMESRCGSIAAASQPTARVQSTPQALKGGKERGLARAGASQNISHAWHRGVLYAGLLVIRRCGRARPR